jgi:HTH-type transcriptional repressor of NAD biosynthesis genes
MSFRRGLVVGKFAPLHRGHELVVERAREQCSEVLVLSYAKPERARCEPALRRRWLERAFPFAQCHVLDDDWLAERAPGRGLHIPRDDAPDDEHRRFLAYLCCDLLGMTVDAVFSSEDYGPGGARVLSEHFRARDAAHPQVVHVMVDRERRAVPISATEIRRDPHRHRMQLVPHVYAAFVERIAIVGGESSGKSTLAAALAERLSTSFAAEYGRELWIARGGALHFDDLLHIAERQIEIEDAAAERAHRYLVCDTTPATTLLYCRDLFGRADPRLTSLAARPYALHVLCAPDFPFVQDGTRRDAAFRAAQHAWYLERLESSGAPWLLAEGPLGVRIEAVAALLASSARTGTSP